MPCNSVAVVAVALKVGTLEEIRKNADALEAIQNMLVQLTRRNVEVTLRDEYCYFVMGSRYLIIGPRGMELTGRFSADEQATIKAFCEALPTALAEQALVTALATQLSLLDDQPNYDEQGQQIGRVLVVRV